MGKQIDYAIETRNLAQMWDRHSDEFLSRYLKIGFYNPFLNPQQIFTRNIIADNVYASEVNFPYILKIILRMLYGSDNAVSNFGMRGATFQKIAAKVINTLEASHYKKQKNPNKITVLDVGCGSGNYYKGLLESSLINNILYTGIDISEKNIKNSRQCFPAADFRVGNILALDFPERAFDLVVVSHVFEHLHPRALRHAIQESIRVAKSTVLFNFFREKDIPRHIIELVEKYHWNFLSRRELIKDIGSRYNISIIDKYRRIGLEGIQFIDRRGSLQSFSSWAIKKT